MDKEKFMKTTPKHKSNYRTSNFNTFWCCVYFRSKKKIQQIDVNKKFQTRIVYDIFVSISCFRLKEYHKNKTKDEIYSIEFVLIETITSFRNVINSSNTLPINFFI
jgi:hypothetical protein